MNHGVKRCRQALHETHHYYYLNISVQAANLSDWRIESKKIDSVVRIEWKLFLLELECSSPRPWYHPEKTFGIVRVIWYILMQSGGSYLQAAIPGTLVTLQ